MLDDEEAAIHIGSDTHQDRHAREEVVMLARIKFGGLAFSCCLAIILSLSLAVPVEASLASADESRQVCENWLTQMVMQEGDWGGEINPRIASQGEIRSGDTLLARYYSIEPSGFVVVPVLKEIVPIKAYSDVSTLDERQEGGFLALITEMLSSRMGMYADRFGSLEAPQSPGNELFGGSQSEAWKELALPSEEFSALLSTRRASPMTQAGPMITTSWSQGAPYNNLCPIGDGGRTVVGCVATAAAQIMRYWEWPPQGTGSFSYTWDGDYSCGGSTSPQVLSATFSDSYDWANMPDSCDGGCTSAEQNALAELSYEVGVAFEMNYGACGSGSNVFLAADVLPRFFKYSADIALEFRNQNTLQSWFDLMKTEISAGRVIDYRISAHSIVLDGWRDNFGQYEYHMNYGWGGPFTTWFVLDSLYCSWEPGNLCPADQEMMVTHIMPQTGPDLSLHGQFIHAESGDEDGHADPGEAIQLDVSVLNEGQPYAYGNASLSTADPYVTVSNGSADFGANAGWGDFDTTQTPFEFVISPSCPDPHVVLFVLDMGAEGVANSSDSFMFFVGDTPGFEDDMESGPGLWTSKALKRGYVSEWHMETYRYSSPDHSCKAGGPGVSAYADLSDAALITPPFLLPANALLEFQHYIDAEEGDPGTAWDGGIVMISFGDGHWTQIMPEGGYPDSIVPNRASPFEPYTPCYSNVLEWTPVVFDLSMYSGVAQIMFRFGSDGFVTEEGWYIDDVSVKSPGCCVDITGNVDDDPDQNVDIGDLTELIRYLYIPPYTEPPCLDEANIDGEGSADIGDLTALIQYLYIPPNPPPAPCP
jgi:hypothetical protein